jgi:hypothetical protein
MTFVSAGDVVYVEADGPGQVILHGRDADRRWPMGIQNAERELERLGFVRVHRHHPRAPRPHPARAAAWGRGSSASP